MYPLVQAPSEMNGSNESIYIRIPATRSMSDVYLTISEDCLVIIWGDKITIPITCYIYTFYSMFVSKIYNMYCTYLCIY